jgi:sugar/nucleoside kinase (ribokinase family)
MRKVGCAGILVADLFCGPIPKLPREGQLTEVRRMPLRAGGSAANVAIDLAKQDIAVDVVGCLGEDSDAAMLRSCFASHGIGCEHLIHSTDYPTSKTVVLLIEGNDRRYLHMFGANAAFSVDCVKREWLTSLGVFYLGGLFAMPKIDPDELIDLLHFCQQNQIVTVVDVVVPQECAVLERLQRMLTYIDYFLPNDDEASQVTGFQAPLDQLRSLRDLGANTVIITKGSAGSVAACCDTFWAAGAYDIPTIDPSGAGDAFASGIIAGILYGWEMPRTLQYASAMGASAVRDVGTTSSVFTAKEANDFVKTNPLDVTSGTLD